MQHLESDLISQLFSLTQNQPCYFYDSKSIIDQIETLKILGKHIDLRIRYAMKANSNKSLLQIITNQGCHIDASSEFEVQRCLLYGIDPKLIQLTSQQLPKSDFEYLSQGVEFVACSLHQIQRFGEYFPGSTLGVRINPGIGSGHYKKVNTGGEESSFGIRYEYIDTILELAAKYKLIINKIHTHIGSGTDPQIRASVTQLTCDMAKRFPDITTLSIGGGFKIKRYGHEKEVNIIELEPNIADVIQRFESEHAKKITLEIEPGTFIVAHSGAIICHVEDIVDTGPEGYKFIKLDIGMSDILRPTLYASQHQIQIINDSKELEEYVIVGHCCESSDLLSPEIGNSEQISTRKLNKATIGDPVVIYDTGAYCASMAAIGYNSFPQLAEIVNIKDIGNRYKLMMIRSSGNIIQLIENEV